MESPQEVNTHPERSFSEAELLEAIRLLPQHHRLVFNLYVFEGFTHAQIGAELGISEGTSKSHLARARKKIRQMLVKKVNENTTRKRLWLLFWLPDQLGMVDQAVKSRLNELELQPQQRLPMDSIDWRNASIPNAQSAMFFSEIFLKIDMASLAIVLSLTVASFLQFTPEQTRQAPAVAEGLVGLPDAALQSTRNTDKKMAVATPPAATLSKNTIIACKPMKTSETMKKVHTVGALLLASTALAFDSTGQFIRAQLPIGVIKRPVVENTTRETARPIELNQPTTKPDSPEMHGTFYASELFWSEENNELYFKGSQVKVSLNTQKFTGSGRFSFLGKLSYLVVNGAAMKIKDTIPLSDKKYRLVKLPSAEAIKKYGDIAKLGAVEITLAE